VGLCKNTAVGCESGAKIGMVSYLALSEVSMIPERPPRRLCHKSRQRLAINTTVGALLAYAGQVLAGVFSLPSSYRPAQVATMVALPFVVRLDPDSVQELRLMR
jgi:hypothetical protein